MNDFLLESLVISSTEHKMRCGMLVRSFVNDRDLLRELIRESYSN